MNNLVIINNGQPVTNSLLVAEVFGKEHNKVCRDIESLSCSDAFRVANFGDTPYTHPQNGQTYKMYQMTKDGFSFLVMGYTGDKAGEFKELFINEFNKRTAMLQSDDYILMRSQEILQNKVKTLESQVYQQQVRIEVGEATIKAQAPKVKAFDEIMSSEGLISINKIAAAHGMSAIKLNRILCERHIQYKEGGTYILYAKYKDKGLATLRPCPYIDDLGRQQTRMHLYWTEPGSLFIHQLLTA